MDIKTSMDPKTLTLIQAYSDWISSYQWDWFFTLTFREKPSRLKALATFRRWIGFVQESFGAADFRWVRVLQFGAGGDNIHFHVLLGGVKPDENISRIAKRWAQVAGWVEPTRFRPDEKAFQYILRFLRPDSEPDVIDVLGLTGGSDAGNRMREELPLNYEEWQRLTSGKLFSLKEFASLMGLTVSCLRRWIHDRKLSMVRLGRLVKIPETERDRLIQEGLRPALNQGGRESN